MEEEKFEPGEARRPEPIAPLRYNPTQWTSGTTTLSPDNMNHIEDGIARLYEFVKGLSGRVEAINSSLFVVDECTGKVTSVYDILRRQMRETLDAVNTITKDWNKLVTAYNKAIDEIGTIRSEMEMRCGAVEAKTENLTHKIDAFSDDYGKRLKSVQESQESISRFTRESVENLDRLIREFTDKTKEKVDALERRCEGFGRDLDALSRKIDSLEKTCADKNKITELEIDGLKKDIRALANRVDNAIKDINSKITSLSEQLSSLLDGLEEQVKAWVDEDIQSSEVVQEAIDKALDGKIDEIVREATEAVEKNIEGNIESIVKEEVEKALDEKDYVTKDQLETEVKSEVEKALEDSDFATKDYVNEKIKGITGEWVTKSDVETILQEGEYTTKTEVEQLIKDAEITPTDVTIDRSDETVYTVGGCEAGSNLYGWTLKEVIEQILWGDVEPEPSPTTAPVITKLESTAFVLYGENVVKGEVEIEGDYDTFTVAGVETKVNGDGSFSVVIGDISPDSTSLECVAENDIGSDTGALEIVVVNAAYETTEEYDNPEEVTLKDGDYDNENTTSSYSFIQSDIPVEADAIYQFRAVEEIDKADRNEFYIPSIFELVGVSVYDSLNGGWHWYQSESIDGTEKIYETIGTREFEIDGTKVEYTGYRIYDKVLHPIADQAMRYFVKLR